ncbi:dolichyl pyrophosphate Man9GlcNAc2 alpha-1,3-glucosyltransferase [Anabrus simplex]|uniref:dolichyl pyrophosphate Man9GlcNAc2 alpha-1,3-glucosyltransferase n=1 Tax=Anabrus simplex TaxID=316456 RepID=UPI0035A397A4
MASEHPFNGSVLLALSFAVLLRWCVSLHPHSGEGKPPMYGDYEAQRHWMEITYNLPLKDWYFNTTDNDLMYWGLDYPPLTAYHSLACGYFASRVNHSFVALKSSRGVESYEHKVFMRGTVLLADLLIYIPAILWYFSFKTTSEQSRIVGGGDVSKHVGTLKCDSDSQVLTIYIALLYPGLILIDYGHFQYNNVSLGLTVAAVAAICRNRELVASVLYCLALNYKQMELYHALPFFFYLLGQCLPKKGQSFIRLNYVKLIKIGFVVVLSFVIVWLPFLNNSQLVLQVIHRLFPLDRGVFEDKVANVWCAINVVYKLRSAFTNTAMAKICLCVTLFAVLPSSIDLLLRPNFRKFVVALINSSLAFFLFSFQVHEKSILLAAVPVILYLPNEPLTCFWFLLVSVFSMLPLFIKDGLLIPCFAVTAFYVMSIFLTIDFEFKEPDCSNSEVGILTFKPHIIDKGKRPSRKDLEILPNQIQSHSVKKQCLQFLFIVSMIGCVVLTFCAAVLKPPSKYPDLYTLIISVYSCGHFLLFFFYFNYRQFCYTFPAKR